MGPVPPAHGGFQLRAGAAPEAALGSVRKQSWLCNWEGLCVCVCVLLASWE